MRADKRKAEVNRKRKSALKTIIKKTQLASVDGKLEEAQAL